MYQGGGKVFVSDESRGWVYLEKDWDGGRLHLDLVEQAGLLGGSFSLLDISQRAGLGGYAKDGQEALFLIEENQFPGILNQQSVVFLASSINNWSPRNKPEKWKMNRNELGWELRLSWHELSIQAPFCFKFITEDGIWLEPFDEFGSILTTSEGVKNYQFDSRRSGRDVFSFEVVDKERNEELDRWLKHRPEGKFGYFKDNHEIGWFRVFAPRAKQVDLLIYQTSDGRSSERVPMQWQEDGSWSTKAKEEWENTFYMLSILQKYEDGGNACFEKIILDPYARATMGRNGPGLILPEPRKIGQESRFQIPPLRDLVITEAHIRDLLEKADLGTAAVGKSWFERLKIWISAEDCYLRELGVNAVEFQPLQEFDSRTPDEYHWGYMPVNFFSPESGYCSSPKRGTAVEEFKQVVEAFHEAGIAVILDVVYNHVGIPGHLMNLDRELYFRIDEFGRLQNFSGCGNDLNCESEPVRKLVIDSLTYLVETFDLDGFRFDLAELLGTDLLQEIEVKMKSIKKNFILIAEPWSFRGRLPKTMDETTYAFWSDQCREQVLSLIKEGRGQQEIIQLLTGKLDYHAQPWQSINYIESHDDYSFVDRILDGEKKDAGKFADDLIKMNRLAIFIILFSPGVPMLSAGQDFMRNKEGVRNTYKRGDLNVLRYEDLNYYSELNLGVRQMIKFRLSEDGVFLRPQKMGDCSYHVCEGFSEGTIGLEIEDNRKHKSFLLVINFVSQNRTVLYPGKWLGSRCFLSGIQARSNAVFPPYSNAVFGLKEES